MSSPFSSSGPSSKNGATNRPDLRQQLQQLVAATSISSKHSELDSGNIAVIHLLAEWLESLGFDIDIQFVDQSRGKANLIATLGQGPGGLVFAGHTDTVPCDANKWLSDPFSLVERDDHFYGLGVTDMKGFFPLAIEAVARLGLKEEQLKQPIIFLATCDEETSMDGAQALVAAGKPKARMAVIGEPTGLKPINMHKGIMMDSILIEGKAGHSSNPALGHNALEAMNHVMNELLTLRNELQQQNKNAAFNVQVPTLNLACIHGGDNPNRICGQCELQFDLRTLPGMNNSELREEIHSRLLSIATEHKVNIDYRSLFTGVESFEQQQSALLKSCEKLTGHKAEAVAFATEAPFLKQLIDEVVVLGPGHIEFAHQVNEGLAFSHIDPAIIIYQSLIQEYCLQ